jgi:branched-chain amino acid transport system ATP-binding protein
MLEFKRVQKKFGTFRAINDLSMHIKEREILGLIGPNGAGKTTVVNSISGVFPIDSGEIEFEGKSINTLPSYVRWNLGITRTFQVVSLCPTLSVKDNILLGRVGKDRTLKQLPAHIMEFAKLSDLYEKLDTEITKVNLFDRKITELLRCLISEPRIILVDELVAGLNDREQDQMYEFLLRINEKGITLLVIEHVMRFVMKICQRIVVMHFGQKLAEGDPVSIVRNPDVIEVYLGGGAYDRN